MGNQADSGGPGFTPISPNPFVVGNPVRDPSMFFGREAEFEEVEKRFGQAEQGGLLIFCGERRSGKTSILFQILQGRLGPNFIPVLIDMQSMAIESEADFLGKIARELAKVADPDGSTIQVPDFSASATPSATFLEFVEAILRRDPTHKPIVLLDEYELLENKIDSGVLSEDVLRIFAHIMEHHSVFMVFTGSEHLEQRRRDYWKVLGAALHRRISYLSRRDAIALITRPVEGRVQFEEDALNLIYRLSAGQPFYTQGVCLYLVDALNEKETRHATTEVVEDVVQRIVDNPFPQMLFLWDGFSDDEKLVLSVLAETLEDGDDSADVVRIQETIRRRKYPLPLDAAQIATTLEELWKREFLHKSRRDPPRYSIRMDLWRHWIKRSHSVWQVVRELKLELGRPAARFGTRARVLLGVVVLLVLAGAARFLIPREGPVMLPDPVVEVSTVFMDLAVVPTRGTIVVNGEDQGNAYRQEVPTGQSYTLEFRASGYVDSSLVVVADSAGTFVHHVELQPQRGDVALWVQPATASVSIDDGAWIPVREEEDGWGMVVATSLEVPTVHTVRARAPGYGSHQETFLVTADERSAVQISLERAQRSILFNTDPTGAMLSLDGRPVGPTPQTARLSTGSHRVRVELGGYATVDTVLTVGTDSADRWFRRLALVPPGYIAVTGGGSGHSVRIWINGEQQGAAERKGMPRVARAPGRYTIRIYVMQTEDDFELDLDLASGQLATLDFSTREWTYTRLPPDG